MSTSIRWRCQAVMKHGTEGVAGAELCRGSERAGQAGVTVQHSALAGLGLLLHTRGWAQQRRLNGASCL